MNRQQKIQILKDIQAGRAKPNELINPIVRVETVADLAYAISEGKEVKCVGAMAGFSDNL